MDWKLVVALVINIVIVVCEVYTLANVKRKLDILKYYTYLQNLLALLCSVVFCVCLALHLFFEQQMPQFARGLRYVATVGLSATCLIYLLFIGRGKNVITTEDVTEKFSPKVADLLLHYLCPALSALSFVAFERSLTVDNGIWTALVNAPSILYWAVYLILTLTKSWKEPYDFSNGKKNPVWEVLTFLLIPLLFVGLSILLWSVK